MILVEIRSIWHVPVLPDDVDVVVDVLDWSGKLWNELVTELLSLLHGSKTGRKLTMRMMWMTKIG